MSMRISQVLLSLITEATPLPLQPPLKAAVVLPTGSLARTEATSSPSTVAAHAAGSPAAAVGVAAPSSQMMPKSVAGRPAAPLSKSAPSPSPWASVPAAPIVGASTSVPSFAQVVTQSVDLPKLYMDVHAPAFSDSGEPAAFFSTEEV